ncbi:sensor domain-containing diguanylate cyclase [Billgrantia endophytica]|uniref:Diguanylate cyclase n=1 Tax=Billgrantia endophytica TaxID=2033802 RepID=A0A2N7TZR1_9GAMM|nr:diguanylate cyclase [Halomonas endophytica]PMR73670.1 diguanylate cyclase [Halomonas endophytica]
MTPHRPPGDGPHGSPSAQASWRYHAGTPLNLLITLVCIVAIVGIWLATLQRIAFEREQAVAAAMQSNTNLAIAFEQQVFRTLKAAEQVAAFVREQYRQQGSGIDLRQWVEQRVIREAMFTIISVVNEAGDIVSSSQETGRVNYADREFFQAQHEGSGDALFVSEPVLGRVSGRWQIPMSLRISRPDGGFGGVVVMSVDPSNFTDFYRQADLGGQGLLELTGFDGIVRGRKIGSQHSFGLDARRLDWFQRRATAPEGEFVEWGDATDGVARIISYRSMAGYPLMVTVGTAYADELGPVLQRRSGYLAMAGGATAALLVFAALLMLVLARQRAVADALQVSEALFRATFHQAAMGIAHIAPDGRILGANDKFCRMLGYSSDELRARTVFELSDRDHRDQARQFLMHRLSAHSPVSSPEIEKPYRRRDGSVLWVCEALGVVKDPQGRPDFLVAVTQDITARKDLEARLSHDALHDALTGLPNRVMFQDRLAQALVSARRHERLTAVLFIDLDGFKAVNDSRGHAAGDALLQQVARRLADCIRAEDTVSRIGGDEFGIVLATVAKEEDCEVVASNIIDALSMPFDLDGVPVHISASVGAALFPVHGNDMAALVAHADTAMYSAKNAGKNRFSWEALHNGR